MRPDTSPKSIPVDAIAAVIGTEVASPWRVVTQAMIDGFADATDDHQFIHVDPDRAAREAPFGGTIAHGFLTLSMLSAFAFETLPRVSGAIVDMNYGFDEIRFKAPVKTGARIRGRFRLADADIRPSGWILFSYDVSIDIEGSVKPALTARWLTLTQVAREAS